MDLLLFLTPDGHAFPLARLPSEEEFPAGETENRPKTLKERVQHAYQKLKEQIDYHERLCSALRGATAVTVYHASFVDPAHAEKKFRNFLKMRYSKHNRWFLGDGVLALLGSVLTPLPGPNVFFFYPAARALGHFLARKGAQTTLSRARISFVAEPMMDRLQEHIGDLEGCETAVRQLEERFQIHELGERLSHIKKS